MTIFRDVRHAARLLGRRPGFSVTAGATIALAIAGNTLVAAEVALTLVLLFGAGLLGPSLLAVSQVPVGLPRPCEVWCSACLRATSFRSPWPPASSPRRGSPRSSDRHGERCA